jgi:nickel-type superoxide dismutase maturation protease
VDSFELSDELKTCGVFGLLLLLLRRRRRFRVSGESMAPLLNPGDEVLIDPGAYRESPPRPGDIVVARHPFRTDIQIVKRVATVSGAQCSLAGDNPNESSDSRTFGEVPLEQIIGKVTARFG